MINRPRFLEELDKRSPLSPDQFESVIGEITESNRGFAWELMNEPGRIQYRVFNAHTKALESFPDAIVTKLRKVKP